MAFQQDRGVRAAAIVTVGVGSGKAVWTQVIAPAPDWAPINLPQAAPSVIGEGSRLRTGALVVPCAGFEVPCSELQSKKRTRII